MIDTTGIAATESGVWSKEEDGGSTEERDGGRRTTEISDARSGGGGEGEGREEEVGPAVYFNEIQYRRPWTYRDDLVIWKVA